MEYTQNPFAGLDGQELFPGERVVAITEYPGSEVEHYHKMRGFVHSQVIDNLNRPGILVTFDNLDRPVLLYPYELMHETSNNVDV